MRCNSKNTFFTLLFCLLLTAVSVSAQKDGDKNLSITFPEVDGWEKGDVTTYPIPELGYSVSYQSEEGGKVTVYVYNGGNKKIADGIEDKIVKKQIEQAAGDIEAFGERGTYQNVKKIKDDTVTLGGANGKVKALYKLYTFEIRGDEVESEIYLFGHQNNFIKIRATRLKSVDGAENADMKKLLAEIDKLFSK